MRVLFIGTGEIGLPALRALAQSPDHTVLAVVTQPDKPVGRQLKLAFSPVKQEAFQLHLKVFQPEKIGASSSVAQLRYLNPDLIVVAAYGQILPKMILDLPKYGCLNLHTSMLPKYRGASPIHSAIAAGEKESGVTIMWMDEGLDTGDILVQQAVTLRRHETAQTLHDRLAKIGADLLLKSIPLVETGNAPRLKQDATKATLTKKLNKEHGHIDWDRPQRQIDAHCYCAKCSSKARNGCTRRSSRAGLICRWGWCWSSHDHQIAATVYRCTRYSRICTAFHAAPLSSWSPATKSARPFGWERSRRMRPTSTSCWPLASIGMGK